MLAGTQDGFWGGLNVLGYVKNDYHTIGKTE